MSWKSRAHLFLPVMEWYKLWRGLYLRMDTPKQVSQCPGSKSWLRPWRSLSNTERFAEALRITARTPRIKREVQFWTIRVLSSACELEILRRQLPTRSYPSGVWDCRGTKLVFFEAEIENQVVGSSYVKWGNLSNCSSKVVHQEVEVADLDGSGRWELQLPKLKPIKFCRSSEAVQNKGGILPRRRFRGFWLRIEEQGVHQEFFSSFKCVFFLTFNAEWWLLLSVNKICCIIWLTLHYNWKVDIQHM